MTFPVLLLLLIERLLSSFIDHEMFPKIEMSMWFFLLCFCEMFSKCYHLGNNGSLLLMNNYFQTPN
jgi:hypothetical protein